MTIIAAITRDYALGRAGDMIHHISADLRRFKTLTMGHPIVMGRKTFESFPNGPLPGRRNLVVTRNPDYRPDGAEVYPSLEEALAACTESEPMIVGGGQIYRQAMPLADKLEITEIDDTAPDADTHFPEIDPAKWLLTESSGEQTDPRTGVRFRYRTYLRCQSLKPMRDDD